MSFAMLRHNAPVRPLRVPILRQAMSEDLEFKSLNLKQRIYMGHVGRIYREMQTKLVLAGAVESLVRR